MLGILYFKSGFFVFDPIYVPLNFCKGLSKCNHEKILKTRLPFEEAIQVYSMIWNSFWNAWWQESLILQSIACQRTISYSHYAKGFYSFPICIHKKQHNGSYDKLFK